MLSKCLLIIATLVFSFSTYAHEGHHHVPHGSIDKTADAPDNEKRIFEQINSNYGAKIKPIFENKCMACHSSKATYPSYYNWPIAKQLIDSDTKEAKEHVGMDNGFPFSGHGTPVEDLDAIKKATVEGSMPPWRYRIMHSGSGLTDEEKKLIIQWVDDSKKLLAIPTSTDK